MNKQGALAAVADQGGGEAAGRLALTSDSTSSPVSRRYLRSCVSIDVLTLDIGDSLPKLGIRKLDPMIKRDSRCVRRVLLRQVGRELEQVVRRLDERLARIGDGESAGGERDG